MDEAASVLIGFPLPSPFPTDEFYDEAVHTHIKKIEELLSRRKDAVSGDYGVQLLKVHTLALQRLVNRCKLTPVCYSSSILPFTPSPTFSSSTLCRTIATSLSCREHMP